MLIKSIVHLSPETKTKLQQESIPVGCVPVGAGGGAGLQVNKFQQVSCVGHQTSLAREGQDWRGEGGSLYRGTEG